MPSWSGIVGKEVASRANGLDQYTKRMEHLFHQGFISKTDITRIYGGAFMSFVTHLERSIERLFLGILMGRFMSHQPQVRALVECNSEVVARAVVRGERSYVDWLPYNRFTEKRAEAFLSGGRPFSSLDKSQKQVLERLSIIRNALAHESAHSLKYFDDTFVKGKSLPPDQHKPGGYLRGSHAIGQTRFNFIMSEAVAVMLTLSK